MNNILKVEELQTHKHMKILISLRHNSKLNPMLLFLHHTVKNYKIILIQFTNINFSNQQYFKIVVVHYGIVSLLCHIYISI